MNLNFNIDLAIVLGFLAINLVVGLYYGRGVTNIRQYALGNRNFSTSTLAATIVATWIGGSFFSTNVAETYKQGLYFILALPADFFVLAIVGYLLAPRMGEFLGKLSVADAMGDLYGPAVRLITSIVGIILSVGMIAMQFKVAGVMLKSLLNISSFYAVLISAMVVIAYSSFGGIKAVTFTDLIQFFTFATTIPILSLIIWGNISDPTKVFNVVTTSPLFDYVEVFDLYNYKFWETILLFLFFAIPALGPSIFQRISMAKDTVQVASSFILAGFMCFFISCIMSWIGILLLADNPTLEPNELLSHIVSSYSYPGLKGMIAAGIIALVISTADSEVNSASIMFAHDLNQIFYIKKFVGSELTISRIFAVFIGCVALFLAFNSKSLLQLALDMGSIYMPIVTTPFLLAIFGFRTTSLSVLIGMGAGLATIVYFKATNVDLPAAIPGMFINAIFLISSHYLLKQQGGWIGIKDDKPLKELRAARQRKIQQIKAKLLNFNFMRFCYKNKPNGEYLYSLFGLFCVVSVYSTMYSMTQELQESNKQLLEVIYHSVLILSYIFITYIIWPPTFKQEKFMSVVWTVGVPYVMVFAPVLLIIIGHFSQFQLMIFLLNIVVMSILFRWHVTILMLCVGIFTGIQFYKWFMNVESITDGNLALQFKVMYVLLLVTSTLIAFLKPKQEYQELVEEKNEHLIDRIAFQNKFTKKHIALGNDFFQNVQHEYHAPMTAVISMAQVLYERFDDFDTKALKKHIKTIYDGTIRLGHFDENITVLSKLVKAYEDVEVKALNLSKIVVKSLEKCQKYYIQNPDDRQFDINIQDGLIIKGNDYYIEKVFDNLIINAIHYCKNGRIAISLSKKDSTIEFIIEDDGQGIPKDELDDIFEPFTVSSRTYSAAEGRGLGLTLCKMIVELHVGEIHAYSDGIKGSKFVVTFPAR